MNPVEEWTDAFGKLVADTTNEADIAGHYPFSPERLRLFVNGTPQLLQYGTSAAYTSLPDSHQLTPQSAGDVVTMETAEKYRYVVQYVTEWSAALSVSQSLQSGDAVTFGYGNADLENSSDDFPGPAADGWFWHWHSGLDGTDVRLAEYRDGEARDEVIASLEKGPTIWKRLSTETNWYNVGNSVFTETFSDEGDQTNQIVGQTSVDNDKGPQSPNQAVQLSIKAESGVGGLSAELGSVGVRTLGDVSAITREKTNEFTATISTTGTWVPVLAMRVDPDRPTVNTQIKNTDIVEFSGSGDVRLMPIAVAPSKAADTNGNALTDSDFSTPEEQSPMNSVLEVSSAVAQFPDSTGAVVTSATNPGGYQLGFASSHSSGSGSKTQTASGGTTRKRQLTDRDICVVLAKADVTGDVTSEIITEQDW